jgi:hypothetical protein
MYHFYSASDTITCQDNGKGDFVGFLPKGDYRVIAVNTRASGVKFADMDRYDKAIVKADYTAGHPDNIYTIVIDEWMNVRERDTVRREPVPVLLTKRLELKFELKGEYENESIDAVEGVLFGLYPSVYLHDGTDVVQTPAAEVSFNTDSERKTQISLFGLRTGYRLVLNLIREGEIVETHDVTEYVINKLSIPILLPATSVTIELIKNKESGGIEIRVEVKEWIPEGEGDPEVIVV